MQRGRCRRMGRANTESPVRVRVHIRGTLNQAAFVAREPKSSGRLEREVGESVPEAPPLPLFFCSRPPSASGAHFCPLPSFTRASAAPELPGATETDGRRCVYS